MSEQASKIVTERERQLTKYGAKLQPWWKGRDRGREGGREWRVGGHWRDQEDPKGPNHPNCSSGPGS